MEDAQLTESERVYALVRQIPKGKVMNYGLVGLCVEPPLPPRKVGAIMVNSPDDVPWWRVVGADGGLPLHKFDPENGQLQLQKLKKEKVTFTPGERVVMKKHRWTPDDFEDIR